MEKSENTFTQHSQTDTKVRLHKRTTQRHTEQIKDVTAGTLRLLCVTIGPFFV